MRLISQLKTRRAELNPGKDILAGIIVALVSIPISMGYAGIAGLPPVYGLYGSLLPILVFGLLSTSPQFVVGVDAMPAVMVGSLLAELGIAAESPDALQIVPLISLLTALWFIIFYLLKAGRIVKYISTPVMGGFISGVGLTIILMQIPKLFGGSAGTGELFALLAHIGEQLPLFHPLSALLGFGTFAVILICKKLIPKVPMTVIMMLVGAVLQVIFRLDQHGVKMLAEVAAGLPAPVIPGFRFLPMYGKDLIVESLSIAAVIMAQTLLASGNYAMKYNDDLDNNKELLAYAGMNLAGAAVGCCPVNGSVSRSGIADSFGCRSQIMSLSAAVCMVLVLLFGTPFLKYLPVPVLTGIVMTALWGILDFKMAGKLWKTSRNEFIVFSIAFAGVLILGTVYGVMVGVVLSFFDVAIASVAPPSSFVGRIPGQGNFYALDRSSSARPIRHAVIYRFSGNLFFANIDRFQQNIEDAIRDETRVVVVDARGISSIDITAAERLVMLNRNLRAKGVLFYLAEHDGSLNDQLKKLGAGSLLWDGVVRRTISLALEDAGITKPYVLEDAESDEEVIVREDFGDQLAEFEWVFGADAESAMERLAEEAACELAAHAEELPAEDAAAEPAEFAHHWGHLSLSDEDDFLDHLEVNLEKMLRSGRISESDLERLYLRAEHRRKRIEHRLEAVNPELLERAHHRHEAHLHHLQESHPDLLRHLQHVQEQIDREHTGDPS